MVGLLKAVGYFPRGLVNPRKISRSHASDTAKSGDGDSLEGQLPAHQPPLVPIAGAPLLPPVSRRLGGAPTYSSRA
jgi:hypothetical protein